MILVLDERLSSSLYTVEQQNMLDTGCVCVSVCAHCQSDNSVAFFVLIPHVP